MADYKILQNIDLAQNEIKEVSKIANDRQDGKDKGLLIQTGNNTSLAFNRKIDTSNTINSIKGTVKDGTGENKKESTLNIEPSKVIISNTKGTETSTNSTITIGLTTPVTPDSEGNEHIEAVSPSIDIKTGKTGVTDYAHPYISLKKDGSTLELQSNTVKIRSKETTESSLTMNGGITGISNDIILKDSSKNVSLNLKSDGTISESANTSITETVGTRSVLLNTEGIKIEDSTTSSTPSIIEVNDKGIKASKTATINNDGSKDSYIDIQSNIIEEKSSNVTIKTPNNVTLTLNETIDKTTSSASLTSTGTITLTSNKGTEKETFTSYKENAIVSKADTIKLQTQGYTETETEGTEHYPHIELLSNESNDYILLEGKTINISSKDKKSEEAVSDKDKKDSINISGTTLNIKDNINTSISSKGDVAISGTESITETSKSIKLTDSLTDSTDNPSKVSLTLSSNGTDGTIEEKASTSITETVDDTVSLTLKKNADSTHSITLENKKDTNTPKITSKIEVLDSEVKISKGSDSYVDIRYNDTDKQVEIEEQSKKVTIKTPNKVTLTLNEGSNGSASLTSKGTITLTSQGDAKTEYKDNAITTEADDIIIKAKGYDEADTKTNYYPHIELKSTKDTDPVNSVLLEGKTINISSKDEGSNKGTITLSGSKLNVESTTTEITSNDINIKKGNDNVLTLNTSTPKITIPSSTATDINSKAIGLGDSGSTTTVSGSKFEVYTNETLIENDTTISGITTIQDSKSSPKNFIKVNETSTSITGSRADIKSTDVNIGTETTNNIIIGRKATSTETTTPTTTLQSSTTNIISPTLNIDSSKVDFKGTNQNVTFKGKGNSSVTSKVPTYIKDTTFSVEQNNTDSSITEVFKVDTSNKSTTINGTTATINPTNVNIGTGTTTIINVGRNATGTITNLKSNTTKIISPTIEIGTDKDSSSSVSIGKDSSTVSLKGNHNLSMTSETFPGSLESEVGATNLRFDNKIYSNDIKIYWDSTLNSLVFAKA